MKANMTKNITAAWAAMICMVAGLVACQDYSIDTQSGGTLNLECDAQASYTVSADEPSDIVFNIMSNTPWDIEVVDGDGTTETWCTVSPAMSGVSGLNSEVVVSMASNSSEYQRTVTLNIVATGIDTPTTVSIVQNPQTDVSAYGDAINNTFAIEGGTQTLKLRSNLSWEIVNENDWVQFSQTSGEATETDGVSIDVTMSANETVDRTATFKVRTAVETFEFSMTQSGLTFNINTDEVEDIDAVSADGATFTIPVDVTEGYNWTVTQDETTYDWFTVAKNDDGTGITVTCESNYMFIPRTGAFTVTMELSSSTASKEVTFTQSRSTDISFLTVTSGNEGSSSRSSLSDDRYTDEGIKLYSTDALGIGFSGSYKRGTFTWEFSEIHSSHALLIAGGYQYHFTWYLPNIRIVFARESGVTFVGASADFITNNSDWWGTYSVPALQEQSASIAKVVLTMTTETTTLTLYDYDGNELSTTTAGAATDTNLSRYLSYMLMFNSSSYSDDYCVIKSFKAETID
ncbi:MAG: BACON domain-containing carbohydrate-binding protein [Bacteroides sp.]|nr:BACON domain-containing carbohydrate-binding protein [Bacteroides sp.]